MDSQLEESRPMLTEEWEVKCLPIRDWKITEKQYKSSKSIVEDNERLEKLVEDIQRRPHIFIESAGQKMMSELSVLSKQCKDEILLLSSRLIAFLDDIKSNLLTLTAADDLPQSKYKWDEVIEDWRKDVKEVSQKLTNFSKIVLTKYKESLISSRQISMDDINSLVTKYITEANQIIISNEKMYANTELHLKLLFDSLLKEWLLNYSYQEIVIGKQMEEQEKNMMDECVEQEEEEVEDEMTIDDLLKILENLEKLIQMECPHFKMIPHFFVYLNYSDMCMSQCKQYHEKSIQVIKEGIKNHYSQAPQRVWNYVVTKLESQITLGMNMTKMLATSWNDFLGRMYENENQSSDSFTNFQMSFIRKLPALEEPINLLLDKLRECSNESSLKVIYGQICNCFGTIQDNYISMRNGEDNIIKRFSEACYLALDIYKYETIINTSPLNIRGVDNKTLDEPMMGEDFMADYLTMSSSKYLEKLAIESKLFREILFYTATARLWLNGARSINLSMRKSLPSFISTILTNWTNNRKNESEYWLKLQYDFLNHRKRRVLANILEVREAELQHHEDALHALTKSIEFLIRETDGFSIDLKVSLKAMDNCFIKYCSTIDKGSDDRAIRTTQLMIERLTKQHNNLKINYITVAYEESNRRFRWMKSSIATFLESIKLFGEGGNYSYLEAEQVIKKINKLASKIKNVGPKCLKKLEHLKSSTHDNLKKKFEKKKTLRLDYPSENMKSFLEKLLLPIFNDVRTNLKLETLCARSYKTHLTRLMDEIYSENNNLDDIIQRWSEVIHTISVYCIYFALPVPKFSLNCVTLLNKVFGKDGKMLLTNWPSRGEYDPVLYIEPTKLHGQQEIHGEGIIEKTAEGEHCISNFDLSDPYANLTNYLSNTKRIIQTGISSVKMALDSISDGNVDNEIQQGHLSYFSNQLEVYNLQCEFAWTRMVLNFSSIILNIQIELLDFLVTMKDHFMGEWIFQHFIVSKDYAERIRILNNNKEKHELASELKALHGYPLNQHLIDNLLNRVNDCCNDEKTNHLAICEDYKSKLKILSNDQNTSYLEMKEKLRNLYYHMFLNRDVIYLIQVLLRYISNCEEWMNVCQNIDEKAFRRSLFVELYEIGVDSKTPTGNDDLKLIVKGSSNITYNLFSISKKFKCLEEILTFILTRTGFPIQESLGHKKLQDFTFWNLWSDEMEDYEKEFHQSVKNELLDCKKEYLQNSKKIEKWRSSWDHDVQKLKNLYEIVPILDPPNAKKPEELESILRNLEL